MRTIALIADYFITKYLAKVEAKIKADTKAEIAAAEALKQSAENELANVKKDVQPVSIITTITELPNNAVSLLKQVGEIPDHVWHMGIVVSGVVLALCHQKELGTSLVMTGVGMFKGKQ